MFEEGLVVDPRVLSGAIKELMDSSGIKGGSMMVSISGLYSLSRIVVVAAALEGATAHQMVLEAIEGVMPFSQEDAYTSWQAIADVEGGQQVLVVSMPRDVIDSHMSAVRMAGIRVRVLELRPLALARAVDRDHAIIVNVEPDSFDIVILANGVAEVVRSTAWQPDTLSVAEEAEHLAMAMELTAGFYDSHHPVPLDPATSVFITGQMSGDNGLVEQVENRISYPVQPLEPPLGYPSHLPLSQYAVNIGLALWRRGGKDSAQNGYQQLNINLLPETYRPWRPTTRQIYFSLAVLVAVVMLFPLYQVTADEMGATTTLENTYQSLNSALEVRKAQLKSREPLQKAVNEYNTIVNMGGGFTEDLSRIQGLAEDYGIEVDSISHVGNKVVIKCHAQENDYESFRTYLGALEESGLFSTPIPPPEGYPYTWAGTIEVQPQ
jgi:hypothetical protein